MPFASPAPADADHPLRLNAQPRGSDTRAHAPEHEALWRLLLAMLAALLGRAVSCRRQSWCYPALSPCQRMQAYDARATAALPRAEEPRSIRRLRAWIGWILRGRPARGMAPTGARPMPPSPSRTARAPPRPPRHASPSPNPSRKPRLRRR